MKKTTKIVVVGSLNIDFVVRGPRLPVAGETVSHARFETSLGGKGGNQAVAVARLGVPTAMVAKTGDDAFGQRLRSSLRAAGVRTSAVRRARGIPSGVAFVLTGPGGENQIVVAPGANSALSKADIDDGVRVLLRSAALVLAQLEVPPAPIARLAELVARQGVPLILDPAPARPLSNSLLRRVRVLTPNETEACVLCGREPCRLTFKAARRLCRQLLGRGPGTVILTLGERGALVAERGREMVYVPGFRVKAVDTTGAGDAFNGALAVGLLEGKTLVEATRLACAAAALSVTRPGAQPSMPTRAELRAFLRRHARAGKPRKI
ncbi:MAG: ribokinase [Terriglobia bacterium]